MNMAAKKVMEAVQKKMMSPHDVKRLSGILREAHNNQIQMKPRARMKSLKSSLSLRPRIILLLSQSLSPL